MRRASAFKPRGNWLELGISTPSNKTGMTRIPRFKAAAASIRTKSSRIIQAPLPCRVFDIQPLPADQRYEHVTGLNCIFQHIHEIQPCFDRVHIHEDGIFPKMRGKTIIDTASITGTIISTIANKNSSRLWCCQNECLLVLIRLVGKELASYHVQPGYVSGNVRSDDSHRHGGWCRE